MPRKPPQAALRAAFEQFLTDFLDLDQTRFETGPIAGSQELTGKTELTPEEHRVVFVLSWTTPEKRRLQLEVLSDGEKVLGLDGDPVASSAVRLIERSTFTILSVDEPFLNAPDKVGGDPWQTRIRLAGGGQATYRFGVLVDSGLKMDIDVTPPPLAAGDSITLTARLTVGEPLSEDVEVIAEVIRPEDSAGNWFATHAVSETELAEVPGELGGDLRARALRKSIYLTDIRGVALPGGLAPTTVTLNDRGAGSDEVSGDGTYTGRFTSTSRGDLRLPRPGHPLRRRGHAPLRAAADVPQVSRRAADRDGNGGESVGARRRRPRLPPLQPDGHPARRPGQPPRA